MDERGEESGEIDGGREKRGGLRCRLRGKTMARKKERKKEKRKEKRNRICVFFITVVMSSEDRTQVTDKKEREWKKRTRGEKKCEREI